MAEPTINKVSFETYAVFDLETTGLPNFNFNKCKITELSLSTISKKDLLNENKNNLPRVRNKITLLFNPMMAIPPDTTKITGLDNYMLEHENRFDENAANTIINFLNHQRNPICLVAHNGTKFDFPVLKKHFDKLNLKLSDNVYCIDSYTAFRSIDIIKLENDNEKDKQLTITSNKEDNTKDIEEEVIVIDSEEDNKKVDMQKINETTPKRHKRLTEHSKNYIQNRESRTDLLSNGHNDTFSSSSKPNGNGKRIRKELFPVNSLSPPKTPKGYYTLGGIYQRTLEKPPKNAHQAEADVEMLQEIMMHYGKKFIDYAEDNAKPFSEVEYFKIIS